jgi:hypothetical protein
MEPGGTLKSDKFMLWIDSVGGFLVCLNDGITIGQPGTEYDNDVPILGDLSPRHARIRRDCEGYLIEALRETRVEGRPVRPAITLNDGNRIELGSSVVLTFRRPHALSGSARLDYASRHRTQPSADAVLLMADSCILGPKRQNHICCRNWQKDVILYRHGEELFCSASGQIKIDGILYKDRGPLTRDSRISGEGFSFKLESM